MSQCSPAYVDVSRQPPRTTRAGTHHAMSLDSPRVRSKYGDRDYILAELISEWTERGT